MNLDLKDLSLSSIAKPLARLFQRYHVIIFAIIAIGGLAVAVYTFYHIIIDTEDGGETTSQQSDGFDKETIEKLRNLQESSSSKNVSLPSGRINPFVE